MLKSIEYKYTYLKFFSISYVDGYISEYEKVVLEEKDIEKIATVMHLDTDFSVKDIKSGIKALQEDRRPHEPTG